MGRVSCWAIIKNPVGGGVGQGSASHCQQKSRGWGDSVSLITDLLEEPANLSIAAKNTVMNGFVYLGAGALLVAWPGATQVLFRDADFIGHERALIRVVGMTVMVIGWLYLFGGRTGARQFGAASVLDRIVLVPAGAFAPGRCWRFSSFAVDACSPRPHARRGGLGASQSREVTIAVAAGRDHLRHADGSRGRSRLAHGAPIYWAKSRLWNCEGGCLEGGGFDRIFAERWTTAMGCGRHPCNARMEETPDTSSRASCYRYCVARHSGVPIRH